MQQLLLLFQLLSLLLPLRLRLGLRLFLCLSLRLPLLILFQIPVHAIFLVLVFAPHPVPSSGGACVSAAASPCAAFGVFSPAAPPSVAIFLALVDCPSALASIPARFSCCLSRF